MGLGVDAQRLEGAEVQLLGIARVRLEDDLELGVALHPVWVVAVARVVRAHAGLGVGDVPGLGAEHAEEGGGVHRARTHLGVVREEEAAPVGGPVLLEALDGLLEAGGVGLLILRIRQSAGGLGGDGPGGHGAEVPALTCGRRHGDGGDAATAIGDGGGGGGTAEEHPCRMRPQRTAGDRSQHLGGHRSPEGLGREGGCREGRHRARAGEHFAPNEGNDVPKWMMFGW
mmetsp:Transcript_8601/g.28159  ORF Transcript_8601/g.28159 Transcript_8601/m.28159 type:complete len:228 (+) Transcript_8601:1349-2032(+)